MGIWWMLIDIEEYHRCTLDGEYNQMANMGSVWKIYRKYWLGLIDVKENVWKVDIEKLWGLNPKNFQI